MVTITKKISNLFANLAFALIVIVGVFLLFNIGAIDANAATCSSISRTNASANSVLTSTRYNSDLNTAYTFLNSWDFGCGQAGTLESDALNSTDFAALLNGITQGCKVTRSDANTLSVDRCIASVNGNFIKTTTSNTVTWGCSSCASETSSTTYYLYIKTGSTGSTLNLLISTTAPNGDGYDNSGNRVLAKFYNDAASDIQTSSIENYGRFGLMDNFVRTTNTAPRAYFVDVNCDAGSALAGSTFNGTATIGNISSGVCVITIPADNFTSIGKVVCTSGITNTSGDEIVSFIYTSTTSISIKCITSGGGACSAFNARIMCGEFLN